MTASIADLATARIRRHEILGGLIHEIRTGRMTISGQR
jgi:hypothetical protein